MYTYTYTYMSFRGPKANFYRLARGRPHSSDNSIHLLIFLNRTLIGNWKRGWIPGPKQAPNANGV